MPTREYANVIYPKFGVKAFHDAGIKGRNVSVYLIDTGLTNVSERLRNVKSRTITNPMGPKNTHGSFVASILGAHEEASADGVPGVAPEASIYLADVSGPDNVIYTSYLVKAIKDAIDLQVDIISVSLGTNVYDQALEDVVKRATEQGILVIAASGNCSCRTYEFPSACDAAISVASMDLERRPSPFNTRNDAVSVFAPGQNILVPGAPTRLSGTSFAVPFASGLVALELSRRRNENPKARMTRAETIQFLRETLALDCGIHSYANDVCYGHTRSPLEPEEGDGIIWLVLLAAASGAVALYAKSLYASHR